VFTDAHALRLDAALYASSLDNFLHRPTDIVARLRERILGRTPPAGEPGPRRVYFSRRGWSMRVMLNEAELEAALVARGFAVVHPEEMSVTEQINLMRDAEVLVAPTGAGLANALFAPLEARIIEIQPVGFGGHWVQQFREVVGGACTVFACPEEVPRSAVPVKNRLRLGFRFAYQVPMAAFLQVVDESL
jgi:capsular polysaccharide biosynthesis protein